MKTKKELERDKSYREYMRIEKTERRIKEIEIELENTAHMKRKRIDNRLDILDKLYEKLKNLKANQQQAGFADKIDSETS